MPKLIEKILVEDIRWGQTWITKRCQERSSQLIKNWAKIYGKIRDKKEYQTSRNIEEFKLLRKTVFCWSDW